MEDFDIDPFGEHESRTDDHTEPMDEHISLIPVGGSTWDKTEESKKHHSEESLKELNL